MIFTAPHFLYGLIFAIIPLVIHIIAKKRIKTVKFSSIIFLLKAAQKQARRYKIRDLLLLILRMLIIIFLVLSIARPVRYKQISKEEGGLLKKSRKSIVIIIDNSVSMGQIIAGESLLKSAQRVAEKIINSQLNQGDNLSVIVIADKNPVKFIDLTYNIRHSIETIKNAKISYLKPDMFKAMKLAERLLDSSVYPTRIIYLITDLQKKNFTDMEDSFINKNLKIKYPVFVINLKTKEIKNSAILQSDIPKVLNFKGDTIVIRPQIKNFSKEKNNLIIKTFLKNEPFGQKATEINPDSNLWLDFENKIKDSGFLFGVSEIADGDDLSYDNKNYFVISIPAKLELCLVEEKSEMFYVINALSPAFVLNKKTDTPLNIFYYNSLPDRTDFDVYVLSQNEYRADIIKRILKSKKSILIFLPDSLDINNFNNVFSRSQLLPGALFGKVEIGKDEPLTLEFVDYTHPAFEIFKNYKSLNNIKIFNYYKFNLQFTSVNTRVLARFSNGDPAILEYSPYGSEIIGSGKIILFLFSPIPDASDIVYHPSFPPLIHQIVKYLTLPQIIDTLNKFRVGQSLQDIKNILKIEAEKIDINCLTDNLNEVLSGDTIIKPGIFKIGAINFAVNMDFTESDLTPVDFDVLKKNYKNINFILFNSEEEVDKKIVAGIYGKHYWKIFLSIALFLLIIEMFIANQWHKILNFKSKMVWK